jgi:hypothetical protein
VNAREEELLQGMGNCYAACGADFEETVRMVGSNRGLTPDQVKEILRRIRRESADDARYRALRARFPADFPC